jgi:hypothetical protein
MKMNAGSLLVLIVLLAGVGVGAQSSNVTSKHLVVLNDSVWGNRRYGIPNAGSVFKLGPSGDRALSLTRTFTTDGQGGAPGALQEISLIQQGAGGCLYLSDAGTADIAAFIYPGFDEVGRYKIPGITNSRIGLAIAARENYLFAGYTKPSQAIFYIATWKINSGCGLTFVTTLAIANHVSTIAISPDGHTLAVGYDYPFPSVDSFSVGSDGTLTEHGPYAGPFVSPTAVDITADSKYALFSEYNDEENNPHVQIGIYTINSDGSLGAWNTFENLVSGFNAGNIWLSPNEKFLFVAGDGGTPIITLDFDESVPQVGYSGCSTNVGSGSPNGMATAFSSGSGGFLYVGYATKKGRAEVGLFRIDSSTGCLTEVPGSPFSTGKKGYAESVVAWPPRPF